MDTRSTQFTIDILNWINVASVVALSVLAYFVYYYSNKAERAVGRNKKPFIRRKKIGEKFNIILGVIVSIVTISLILLNDSLTSQKETKALHEIELAKKSAAESNLLAKQANNQAKEINLTLLKARVDLKREDLRLDSAMTVLNNTKIQLSNSQKENAKVQMELRQGLSVHDVKITDIALQSKKRIYAFSGKGGGFVDNLRKYPEKKVNTVVYVIENDREAHQLAQTLATGLAYGGWANLTFPVTNNNLAINFDGVSIITVNENEYNHQVSYLKDALEKSGIPCNIVFGVKANGADIILYVGTKP